MPVSRNDFQRGRSEPSNSEKVIAYLKDHPDHAFTGKELSNAVRNAAPAAKPKGSGTKAKVSGALTVAGSGLSYQGFRMSLDVMVAERKLDAKFVKSNGKTSLYYTLHRGKAKN